MLKGQKLNDKLGNQVALFPLTGFHITQTDYGTFSHHGGSTYWATDYIGWEPGIGRVLHAPCFAPVDIKLIFKDADECVAVWESVNKVHLANDTIDYLTLTCYHDNRIEDGDYYSLGTIKEQGEEFFITGTGGNVTGDHIHLETGYGRYETSVSTPSGTPEYKYHITDYTNPKRLHNYNALFINDTDPIQSPTNYDWLEFTGGEIPTIKKSKFPWFIYANRIRNKNN